jgi:hypothetical protein
MIYFLSNAKEFFFTIPNMKVYNSIHVNMLYIWRTNGEWLAQQEHDDDLSCFYHRIHTSVRLKKILIYLFFLISLFFLLVYYTWQKLFSAPFGLYWFIVAFSPLCVMPLRTHGKDSRVKKKRQQPKSKLRELLGYFSCVARESVDGRRIHLWGPFFSFTLSVGISSLWLILHSQARDKLSVFLRDRKKRNAHTHVLYPVRWMEERL